MKNLKIAALPVGDRGGAIGVTFAPGKHQSQAMTGAWARDLEVDLAAIRAWGATHLITLLEPWELIELQIEDLPAATARHGLKWHSLPITDGAPPDERFLEQWKSLWPLFTASLHAGIRMVVHCKGGLGRAGTVASLLLLGSRTATDANDAMARVREIRPGAIETQEQEDFLAKWRTVESIPSLEILKALERSNPRPENLALLEIELLRQSEFEAHQRRPPHFSE